MVLQVLYLMFNEGYTTSVGPDLQRADLGDEAIRLTRAVHRLLPDDGEVAGLLALMLLTDARRAARTGPDGALIPLAEQDRSRWDHDAIAEGVDLVTRTLASAGSARTRCRRRSPRCTTRRATADDTDWLQILALYDVLGALAPNPMVTLNRAVARGDGARARGRARDCWSPLDDDDRMAGHHRLHAVRAHLLEMAGDTEAARAGYREAARRTTSPPEQRYLEGRAARLRADADDRSRPR